MTAVRNTPALAAITGSFIAMAVAASAAAAFHHSATPDTSEPFHLAVRLESLHGGYAQVYAHITVTYAEEPVALGGGLQYVVPAYETRDGMLVYSGLLNATRAVYPGDAVHVVVYHPSGQHIREVTVW